MGGHYWQLAALEKFLGLYTTEYEQDSELLGLTIEQKETDIEELEGKIDV
ncbi:MAG: hypothetical protein GDA44_09360 [Prochloron sp. SP5CPC1]|nr:hypothetical protein [Candidatus Paraprochloron terpiosi SP5CPC1]